MKSRPSQEGKNDWKPPIWNLTFTKQYSSPPTGVAYVRRQRRRTSSFVCTRTPLLYLTRSYPNPRRTMSAVLVVGLVQYVQVGCMSCLVSCVLHYHMWCCRVCCVLCVVCRDSCERVCVCRNTLCVPYLFGSPGVVLVFCPSPFGPAVSVLCVLSFLVQARPCVAWCVPCSSRACLRPVEITTAALPLPFGALGVLFSRRRCLDILLSLPPRIRPIHSSDQSPGHIFPRA